MYVYSFMFYDLLEEMSYLVLDSLVNIAVLSVGLTLVFVSMK